MKTLKVSDLLKYEIKPFLFGVFLSRIMEDQDSGTRYFYAYTKFKSSKLIFRDDFDLVDYSKILKDKYNHRSGYYNWEIYKATNSLVELRFYVINDLNLTKVTFYRALYNKMLNYTWTYDENINDSKKDFIRGFVEPRGSVDTTTKLIAQDYFYDNKIQLKKAQILTDIMSMPICYANLNMRDLQPQFVSGQSLRNTQFRTNAFYYAKEIGFINDYKSLIFEKAYNMSTKKYIKDDITYFNLELTTPRCLNDTFSKYLNFFTNNIYEKNLSPSVVDYYRKKLGFNTEKTELPHRNQTIIDIFNEISENKCAICGTEETFESKKTGKQFFEIHHMISYCNGSQCDNIANLVKLCPTCHSRMKKNAAPKDEQMKAILKILHEHEEIFEFTSSFLDIEDINELAEKIWEMLG